VRPIPPEIIQRAAEIIATEGISNDEIKAQVGALVDDPVDARRLLTWIPEAFGMTLVASLGDVTLPRDFTARDAQGKARSFPLTSEPIYLAALELARAAEPRDTFPGFSNIAFRSSIFHTANNALDAGLDLADLTFSGPSLIGIPAEIYGPERKSFWRRLFS
jgi:hypothetical protein